MSETNNK